MASKHTKPALDKLDFEILRAVRARSGSNLKDIYMPLVRPGVSTWRVYTKMKLLEAANFICLRHVKNDREFKTSLTEKGRRHLDNEKLQEKENMTEKVHAEAAKMRPSASLEEICDPTVEAVADGS